MPQLNVPHISQQGNATRNDCAQASATAIVNAVTAHKPTLNQLIAATNSGGDNFTTISGLMAMCAQYGAVMIYSNAANLDWYKTQLDDGRPCIALLDYRPLIAVTGYNYRYAHFAPVVGYDDARQMVTVLDPLTKVVDVPYAIFEAAISTPSQTLGNPNPAYLGLATKSLKAEVIAMLGGFNLDLMGHADGAPAPALLRGTQYARFPFNVSKARKDGSAGNTDLAYAFNHYDGYINALKANSITPVVVLGHEVYGEGAGFNWEGMSSGDWQRLIANYTNMVNAIARHYAGKGIVWQVWNEQDADPGAEASVPVPAPVYGELFRAAYVAIKNVDTSGKVITGGHMQGAGRVVDYLKLSKTTSVADAEAFHPYVKTADGFPFEKYDSLEGYIRDIQRQIGTKSMWFTEFGGIRSNPPFERIIAYAKAFLNVTRPRGIPALWFAIADGMHGCAGALSGGTVKVDKYGYNLIDPFRSGAVQPPVVTPPSSPVDYGEPLVAGELEILYPTAERFNLTLRSTPSKSNSNVIGSLVTGTVITAYSKKYDDGVFEWTYTGKGWFASKDKKGGWSSRVKKITVSYIDL
jgi:hypothetical protein